MRISINIFELPEYIEGLTFAFFWSITKFGFYNQCLARHGRITIKW